MKATGGQVTKKDTEGQVEEQSMKGAKYERSEA